MERHANGFLQATRRTIGNRDARIRAGDYQEIYNTEWDEETLRTQGRRCMDCGVPTCMGGCPIGNLIPEWNDLVHRDQWREALSRLHATNNFPEFTGYTCPAPCEPACVLALDDAAVTIKSLERAIVDKGWDAGWIMPEPPTQRTPFKVAVVGSGPAGLAAAQQLNRAGHNVIVYERDDTPGGLMTYGIPDFKFAKFRVARRIQQLIAEGIEFRTGINVGKDLSLASLRKDSDAVCLALGALAPRNLSVPGRNLSGIEFAMDFLVQENRRQAGRKIEHSISARDRRVVVLGGGDTGADCVATARRQGAACVTQVDVNTIRPRTRPPDNPWPEQSITLQPTYAQQEGSVSEYGFETLSFEPAAGTNQVAALHGQRVAWTYTPGRKRLEKSILIRDVTIDADLVLLAVGFEGPELEPFKRQISATGKGLIHTDSHMKTNLDGVFAAGDACMGQSIVVWAIGEGRDVARQIDIFLAGESALPASLRTANPPTAWAGSNQRP